ncbi:MAG: helix-turn-helix domain-containing protein [Myxococcales bacterium]|nr:helix-turn-helix domain-containing protein [Myxococcales bacterium]
MSAAVDQIFAALSSGVRRGIVAQLATGSTSIAELRRDLPFSKQAMTRHVAVLEEAGLVRRITEGRTHRLQLVLEPLLEVQSWVDERAAAWRASFDRLDALLDAQGEE